MLRVGIVGLPNVGKSTLFNALTRSRKAEAANFPFCTIEPNVGVVTVPDARLARLAAIINSQKTIPAAIEVVDIAGLVKGASEGEGLGNQFLGHIREVDAIVQVVRCFDNENIHHVAGNIDPIRDIEIINTELILADMAAVQKRIDRQAKAARTGDKVAKAEIALGEKLLPHLNSGAPASTADLSLEEKKLLETFYLLSAKPVLFAANVEEQDLSHLQDASRAAVQCVKKVEEYAKTHFGTSTVVISAQIESELAELSPEDAAEYLAGLGLTDSGVGLLIRKAYELLGLRTYFTYGPKETRAWTIHAGDKAPAAAGVIHSDFERGFIAAETMAYDDLNTLGSTAKCREAGKFRIEGKEYEVKDGDVLEFRFNV
ncbi:MAG: redox-regulated ATPase YchF [Chthoniobacterales bacterium]|nr:redox-regulated ATPase YchF [Chthoniobacterales bacterium]